MVMNLCRARDLMANFAFSQLFITELGWSNPTSRRSEVLTVHGITFTRQQLAQIEGVVVIEITAADGAIPDARTRAAVYKEIIALHHENILIFCDAQRSQSLWYWVKRVEGRLQPREHIYVRGQPGDLFLSKLSGIFFDLSDFDDAGHVGLVEVLRRLGDSLDVERVTKHFFTEFQEQHLAFIELIRGITDEHDRRWYASVLLNRLMFVYFLQRKFMLDGGDERYLQKKLAQMQEQGRDLYYSAFLKALFFEGFAKPEEARSADANRLLGHIRYLNGGLFLQHPIEQRWPGITVPDAAFSNLYALFERYSWNLNDTPGGADNEINPDVLGYIFEKYINQKAFGAYYTRPEITEYLCERTIHRLVLDAINTPGVPGLLAARQFDSVGDLLLHLDAPLCRQLAHDVLPGLRLLDPACGSGAFLVAAMKTLVDLYAAVIGKIRFLNDHNLAVWLADLERKHPSIPYAIKKAIITNNLYGADIMEEAVEIAKLRLFLALVASASREADLEPLPNIDFNIVTGNSLVGLLQVDAAAFEVRQQRSFFMQSYQQILVERERLLASYRAATTYADDLRALRDKISDNEQQARAVLDEMLLDEFRQLSIKYEQATWDDAARDAGRPRKRDLRLGDIQALEPLHWGFEFAETLANPHGGFDAILTNPPWEIFKPNGKEFFEAYSDLVTRKKMTIHQFEAEQEHLLADPDLRQAWLTYLSGFPHVSAYYRSAPQYAHQSSEVNGKKTGSDINLYKLFTEQCANLLRPGGYAGMVLPSGLYTDLGAKGLREMLFRQNQVTGLFCFENRKEIFEGVHRSFKFIVLTWRKGGSTQAFPAAFMRHEVSELARFPREGALEIPLELVKRLSPDSLSVMEFKSPLDIAIAEKMLAYPLLGEDVEGKWKLRYYREFGMGDDGRLFQLQPGPSKLPLFEGKMMWQFDHTHGQPRYWLDEKKARQYLLDHKNYYDNKLNYTKHRIACRRQSASTNERTLVVTIAPKMTFFADNLAEIDITYQSHSPESITQEQCYICALFNSFVLDYTIRQRITTNLSFFYIDQFPVPRLIPGDAGFTPISIKAAQLICTVPEFDALAREAGLRGWHDGATDPAERARLRAELDALVARLYNLTEEEFSHVLGAFPIVKEEVKQAALEEFRRLV